MHEVAWDGNDLVLASTGNNRLVWIDPAGRIVRTWQAPGNNDAWHLNCLAFRDDLLHATAFCRASDHRAWFSEAEHGRGVLFTVPDGRVVVEGLRSPHTPRRLDGMWLVLDSASRALSGFDPDTCRCVRRVDLGGWTRGLAASDDHLFVGVSATRRGAGADPVGRAHVVVLNRATWTPMHRIALPWQEVYELLLLEPELADGLRRGCDTNPLRTAEARAHMRRADNGTSIWREPPLPDVENLRVSIDAAPPAVLRAGSCVEVARTIHNRGAATLVSGPPAPVLLTYKWLEADTGDWTARDGREVLQSVRTRLPADLPPGRSLTATARVEAPPHPRAAGCCD